MTREDIIAMARKSGFLIDGVQEFVFAPSSFHFTDELTAFAALVAAAAKAEEREAIAQIIEDALPLVDYAINERGGCLVCGFTPKLASEFIRERGETK